MEKGKVRILRYNPETDSAPHYETYEFPFKEAMTVLDVATYIYQELDGTFSFTYSCSNSHCGLCGAKINGRPGLMCREQATREMTLEPLDNVTVIRDLMLDRDEYELAKDKLRLFLERADEPAQEPEAIKEEDWRKFAIASRCVECYSCVSVCPSLRQNRHQYIGPEGIVQLARHAFDPRDGLDRELMAVSGGLYNCTGCGSCTAVCPHDIEPSHNIEMLRQRLVAKGEAPRAVMELAKMATENQKLIVAQEGKAAFTEQAAGDKEGPAGLFVGCVIDLDPRLQPIAFSAVKVLQKLGKKVAVPKEQVCCGQPLKEVGAEANMKEMALLNIDLYRKAGCKTVITLCSGCGSGLKTLWPKYYKEATGKELPFEVLDFSEYLAKEDWKGQVKELPLKVTYHEPCTLGRGQGVTKEPREIINSIPGVKFTEMAKADDCCGGGGGVRVNNLKLSQRILKDRVASFKDMDVNALVTSCPTCIKQFTQGLAQAKRRDMEVIHPAVLVAKAMQI